MELLNPLWNFKTFYEIPELSSIKFQYILLNLNFIWSSTGCPQKNFRLLWKALAPLIIIVVIKLRGDSESTVAELSMEYFPVAQLGAEIFEFKVDPVPNLTFFNVMSGVESNTFFDFKKA